MAVDDQAMYCPTRRRAQRRRIRVVDLTKPLGPETPVIGLPPIFASSPGVTLKEISRYDDQGPAWYWNTLPLGEHTGTHFDAPVHWITGKDLPDNARDTIAPRVHRPGLRHRRDGGCGGTSRFPADARARPGLGDGARPDSGRRLGAAAHRLERRARRAVPQRARGRPPQPRRSRRDAPSSCARPRRPGRRRRDRRHRCRAGRPFDPPFPNHTTMHGAGKFGLASLINLDQLPATGAIVIAAPLKIVGGRAARCASLHSHPSNPSDNASRQVQLGEPPLALDHRQVAQVVAVLL